MPAPTFEPSGTEPRYLLVSAWLMPFSLVALVGAPDLPFVRVHAVHGTLAGCALVGLLALSALVPAWLGLPWALTAGTWLCVACLRGMLAALAGRPPPAIPGVDALAAHILR
jgi:hypothetical protein